MDDFLFDKRIKTVVVGGMFSPGYVWYNFKNKLEATRKVEIIDFPMSKGAFGYIYSGSCQLDFNEKLQYLLEVLRSIKGEYELIGHSAGAILVLRAAMESDINPTKIFLISPAAVYGIFNLYPSVIRSFWFVLKDPYFRMKSISIPYDQFRWSMAHTLEEKEARKISQCLREESGRFISQVGIWGMDPKKSVWVDFEKINDCPVCIFVGDQDRVTPEAISWKIKDRLDLARSENGSNLKVSCRVFQGCSHWLIEEAQTEMIEIIEQSGNFSHF